MGYSKNKEKLKTFLSKQIEEKPIEIIEPNIVLHDNTTKPKTK